MAENPRIEELRRRVQADPASIAFAALAEEFRRVGRYEDAIETCRTGLQRHPAYLSARVTLGRALIELGELDAAREELETVLTSAPENLAAIRGLAQIHERLGHSAEMDPSLAALLQKSAAAPPRPPAPPAPPPEPVRPEPIKLAPEPIKLASEPIKLASAPDIPIESAPERPPTFVPPLDDADRERAVRASPAHGAGQEAPASARLGESEAQSPPENDVPDPAVVAAIARLERFLGAIQAARRA